MSLERDEWLMSQVAAGRQGALEVLIRRHATTLLTFIRRLVVDHHRGEELFQEVFVAVWRRRGSFDVHRPFRPWLYAIALNLCRGEFRRRRARPAPVGDGALELVAAVGGEGDVALGAERATLVLAALDELPTRQRAVVALRVWSGMSYAEIGEALGRNEATVRATMHQGLASLRRKLEPRMRGG